MWETRHAGQLREGERSRCEMDSCVWVKGREDWAGEERVQRGEGETEGRREKRRRVIIDEKMR